MRLVPTLAQNNPAEAEDSVTAVPLLLRLYKDFFSPLIHAISPTQCKYLPTCSEYAYVAVARHGLLHGGVLALKRVLCCNPLSTGGLDPVPVAPPARGGSGLDDRRGRR